MKIINAGVVGEISATPLEHLPSSGFSQKDDCRRALRSSTNIDNVDY